MIGSPLTGEPLDGDPLHLLSIYLRDHEAAAAGGLRLAERCWKANRNTPYAEKLRRLATEIRADRDALQRVCTDLGVRFSRPKRIAAWAGATFGRFKLNGRLLRYSPLSRVLELEALSGGVTAKLRLWESLLLTAEHQPHLDRASMVRHASEATEQLNTLGQLHDLAIREAFG